MLRQRSGEVLVSNDGSMFVGDRPENSPHAERWFAIAAKSRHEKSVAEVLGSKGFEQFLPLYQSARQWSDRVKLLELPLFPGYLFCRFRYTARLKILQTPGVRKIVTVGKVASPVPDEEIQSIRLLVSSRVPIEPAAFLYEGQRVRVVRGPLTGVIGFVQRIKSVQKLVVSVGLLQRSVAVELDRHAVIAADREFSSSVGWYRRQLEAIKNVGRPLSAVPQTKF
jgi:transcription antitermination factor NusG